MNEDTSKLMETHEQLKVDLSGTIHNSTGGFGDHSTKEMVDMARNYYKNFDSEVIDRLLVIYKHDMLPFGYRHGFASSSHFNTATCIESNR